MKLTFAKKLLLYVFIRMLVCILFTGAIAYISWQFISIDSLKITLTVVFGVFLCLLIAETITRHVSNILSQPLTKLLDAAEMLTKSSQTVIEAAKCLDKKNNEEAN